MSMLSSWPNRKYEKHAKFTEYRECSLSDSKRTATNKTKEIFANLYNFNEIPICIDCEDNKRNIQLSLLLFSRNAERTFQWNV